MDRVIMLAPSGLRDASNLIFPFSHPEGAQTIDLKLKPGWETARPFFGNRFAFVKQPWGITHSPTRMAVGAGSYRPSSS
jgi:hypothetical protein